MKIGFDLDGTLDRPVLADLCCALLRGGDEVHIISGVFPEAKDWQDEAAKVRKLERLGIPFVWRGNHFGPTQGRAAILHVLDAVPATFDRDYRLADLGLRKGALCEELGIRLFLDDSALYCEMIPKMSGDTLTLKVGNTK